MFQLSTKDEDFIKTQIDKLIDFEKNSIQQHFAHLIRAIEHYNHIKKSNQRNLIFSFITNIPETDSSYLGFMSKLVG